MEERLQVQESVSHDHQHRELGPAGAGPQKERHEGRKEGSTTHHATIMYLLFIARMKRRRLSSQVMVKGADGKTAAIVLGRGQVVYDDTMSNRVWENSPALVAGLFGGRMVPTVAIRLGSVRRLALVVVGACLFDCCGGWRWLCWRGERRDRSSLNRWLRIRRRAADHLPPPPFFSRSVCSAALTTAPPFSDVPSFATFLTRKSSRFQWRH